jgi:3',5'-cyclic AMP phosphodiesterase CpdA
LHGGYGGAVDLTTVADDLVVIHDGHSVSRFDDLQPDTTYELLGLEVTTLSRPAGQLLSRFATVNDVHFGEVVCGKVGDSPDGPIQQALPGEPPYPDTMNRAVVAELAGLGPDAVIVKGDLTNDGRPEEFEAFEALYHGTFGDSLHVVRGNHDAYKGQHRYAGDQWIELPGVAVALLDTVIPTETTGTLSTDQLAWLADHAAAADRPVIVLGHHQQWIAGGDNGHRSEGYFGMHPDASDGLAEVVRHHTNIVAYAAGHTHRHRVRHMANGVPTIEVGCVKDFPGTWAEYRVYEGGITQVVHRISAPDALTWSDRCRHLYSDFGVDYESYALGTLEDRCCNIPLR